MKGRSPLSRQSPFVIALIYSMKVRHMLALAGNPWCRIIHGLHEQAKIILMALETGFLLLNSVRDEFILRMRKQGKEQNLWSRCALVCVIYLGLYFFFGYSFKRERDPIFMKYWRLAM